MGLETVTHISDLVVTNPTSTDAKSQGDDHLRAIKTAIKNDFAGFTGAVVVTGTDGGAADVYTCTPTTALAAYGTNMAVVFTPAATNLTTTPTINISALGAKSIKSVAGAAVQIGDLVAGSIYVAIYNGSEFRLVAPTKNYIDQLAFSTTLPSQTGNAGKFVSTNGSVASWGDPLPAQTGHASQVLKTDGSTASWQKMFTVNTATQVGLPVVADASGDVVINVLSPTAIRTASAAAAPDSSMQLWGDGWRTASPTIDLVSTAAIVASAASHSVTIPTGYNDFVLEIEGLTQSSAQALYLRINNSTAAKYSYVYQGGTINSAATFSQRDGGRYQFSGFEIDGDSVGVGTNANFGADITITLHNTQSTTTFKRISSHLNGGFGGAVANTEAVQDLAGTWESTAAITAVNIVPAAAVLLAGKTKLWGKKG